MWLPFLDREQEVKRLERLLRSREGALGVLFGRRRCGKSRLLQEVLHGDRAVYYLADERDGSLQRAGLAREISRVLPGFDSVHYPDWESLFGRWWQEAGRGATLVIDEFPALVAGSREIPSLLQRHVDLHVDRGLHTILCGSSQRMMQGLVLDRSAPLYGRAREILKISPLAAGWILDALRVKGPAQAVESFAVWGGIPRYWELAADFPTLHAAVKDLVLDPLGVLHREPERLLMDDLREVAQAASILGLIGRGCHRISEIASRLQKPTTSLSRPLHRLVELELVRRDMPFGSSPRSSKRTLYRLGDPFLRFWFSRVEANLTRLEAREIDPVLGEIHASFEDHVASVWEELARASVPRLELFGRRWKTAAPWWGAGLDRRPLEIDIVAESVDGKAMLLGEAKWSSGRQAAGAAADLASRAKTFPPAVGRRVHTALWLREAGGKKVPGVGVVTPAEVLGVLR